MVEKGYTGFQMICDMCGEEFEEELETYKELSRIARKNGWKVVKGDTGYYHYCPECAEVD